MSKNIDDHPAEHPQRLFLAPWLVHLLHLGECRPAARRAVDLSAPDLARPEEPPVLDVLAIVPDDVRLLQHQAHRVCQLELLAEPWCLLPRRRPQPRQALTHEPRDVMAVQVVVRDLLDVHLSCRRRTVCVVRHAVLHLLCDVDDHIEVSVHQLVRFDGVEIRHRSLRVDAIQLLADDSILD